MPTSAAVQLLHGLLDLNVLLAPGFEKKAEKLGLFTRRGKTFLFPNVSDSIKITLQHIVSANNGKGKKPFQHI